MLNQGKSLELNSKGYLVDFDAWDRDFAIKMAKDNNVVLTECHWLVINCLRDYQAEYGIAPEHREIIKRLSEHADPSTPCTKNHLEGMFGEGGCDLACRMAGLPDCHCRGV